MKSLKFTLDLAEKILTGEKTTTWRLFDDKNLTVGDHLTLINSDTKEPFAEAEVTSIVAKKLGEVTEKDFEGHEAYPGGPEQMLQTYRGYYGDRVTMETVIKIIEFKTLI